MATALILDIAKRAKGGKYPKRGEPSGRAMEMEEEETESEGGDEYDSIKASAAKDMFQAVKDDDLDMYTAALGDYVEACIEKHKSEPPPDEE